MIVAAVFQAIIPLLGTGQFSQFGFGIGNVLFGIRDISGKVYGINGYFYFFVKFVIIVFSSYINGKTAFSAGLVFIKNRGNSCFLFSYFDKKTL